MAEMKMSDKNAPQDIMAVATRKQKNSKNITVGSVSTLVLLAGVALFLESKGKSAASSIATGTAILNFFAAVYSYLNYKANAERVLKINQMCRGAR